MPQPRSRTIDVLVDHELAGRMQLEIDERSPLEFVSFTYVPEWLANPDAFEISP